LLAQHNGPAAIDTVQTENILFARSIQYRNFHPGSFSFSLMVERYHPGPQRGRFKVRLGPFHYSSRNLLLTLSMNAFCTGLPGSMWCQASIGIANASRAPAIGVADWTHVSSPTVL
jgi:hypothetical protein